MKTWSDRLRERTQDELLEMIRRQKSEIEIKQRDLKVMEGILAEKGSDYVQNVQP